MIMALVACGPPPPAAMPPVEKGPATRAVQEKPLGWITLSRAEVRAEAEMLMAAPEVKSSLGTRCGLEMAPLTRALEQRGFRGPLLMKVAPDLPFELLCSALSAAWSAGVLRVRLEVPGVAPQEVGPPPLPPGPPPPGKLATGMHLSVVAGDSGYFIGGAGALLTSVDGTWPTVRCRGRCRTAGGKDPYGHDGLAGFVGRIKKTYPDETVAVLSADPLVPSRVVLRTLAALRGAPLGSCAPPNSCLFPRLSLVPFSDADARVAAGGMLAQVKGSTVGHAYTGKRPVAALVGKPGAAPALTRRVPAISGPRPGTTLTPASSAAVIRSASPAAQKCYERALTSAGPGLQGKIVMTLVVGPAGKVAEVTVHSDGLGSRTLIACLRGVLLQLMFRPPFGGGKVVLQVPYVFKTK